MSLITSQQIKNYYEKFGGREVTFTRDIIKSLGLARELVQLNLNTEQYPCTIVSSSMQEAKVVMVLPHSKLKSIEPDNLASLRFSFYKEERTDTFSFFVKSRVKSITAYDSERDLYFIHLMFTQQPPDNLIEILGRLIELHSNTAKRGEDRIKIDDETKRRLGLASKSTQIVIDRIPRNGILRDVSFNGLNVIIMGNAKFLLKKTIYIPLSMVNGDEITMKGSIVRYEPVEGHKDLVVLAVKFEAEEIPFNYKKMINEGLKYLDVAKTPRQNS